MPCCCTGFQTCYNGAIQCLSSALAFVLRRRVCLSVSVLFNILLQNAKRNGFRLTYSKISVFRDNCAGSKMEHKVCSMIL